MNENIDLTKILKDCPKGIKLYSTIFGEVDFIECNLLYQIVVAKENKYYYFTSKGTFIFERIPYNRGECCLFPNKEQRDWSKFNAPWYKKERFDTTTLKPFDKVLVRDSNLVADSLSSLWTCQILSHIKEYSDDYPYVCINEEYKFCIPYNDDTKYLVGTNKEAPEYYRY